MEAPVVLKPIPAQIVNEQASFGPFRLTEHINAPEGSERPRFTAELKDGSMLPTGLICTSDGMLTGIPARDTNGNYEIVITAENAAGSVQETFVMTIRPSLVQDPSYLDTLKAQVWEALNQNLPIPEHDALFNMPISVLDIHYLLERWGYIRIWDAFNLESPGAKIPLNLEGASPHYYVYDMGSCLIAGPKDLFSHERTLEDGLQTARALAREVYHREWTVELVGYEKFTKAAWVELQHLGDLYNKQVEIINYRPSTTELRLYKAQVNENQQKNVPE